MFERIPSLTAASVAAFRALSSLPGAPFDTANDESLRVLAPRPIRAALGALGHATARMPSMHSAFRVLSGGLYDHIALRTRAIDVALLAELARGTRQLVICGAGLDARAFRLPELDGTLVYEVDHPATQRLKRARARVTRATAKSIHFVPVDFERESLDRELAAAGHDAGRPTVWIWEGVTMYLAPPATRATLQVIAQRSAPGSLALVTYSLPELVNAPRVLLPAIDASFRLLGEPLSGRLSSADVAGLAEEVGLTVEADTGERDWQRAHLRAEPFGVVIEERLAALRR